MFKTWICKVLGGGTPTFLVSTMSEKDAWKLIRKELELEGYGHMAKDKFGGLIEVSNWHAVEERIDNIDEMYSHNGILKEGSFKDFC